MSSILQQGTSNYVSRSVLLQDAKTDIGSSSNNVNKQLYSISDIEKS